MRKKIAAGNWKMNTTLEEGWQLITSILDGMKKNTPTQNSDELNVIMGTPFVTLHSAAKLVSENPYIKIAAQNCYNKEKWQQQ